MKIETKFEIGMKPWFINEEGEPEQSEYPITCIRIAIIEGEVSEKPCCRTKEYDTPWSHERYDYECFPTREDAIESTRKKKMDEIAELEEEERKIRKQIELKKKELQ